MSTETQSCEVVLPGYTLTERIGSGGYAEVWRAEAPGDTWAWRALLADELALGLWFRKLYGWLGDRQIDHLLQAIAQDGLKDLIRRQANFDWHRELITELGRRLPLGKLALGTLFGL